MLINEVKYKEIVEELRLNNCTLVAVSKLQSVEAIQALYNLGQRDFGENYVQELIEKVPQLPSDIRWHFIGHLQTNKVKYIIPFVHLIHSIDSEKLLIEVNKQALKINKKQQVLLQLHIAKEETKFGFDSSEIIDLIKRENNLLQNIQINGLMGMASFTDDNEQVEEEFDKILYLKNKLGELNFTIEILSFGMSSDYKIALGKGSNMVRIGSLLFGERV